MIGLECQESIPYRTTEDSLKNDFSNAYLDLIVKYKSIQKPVEVDFRELVNFYSGIDRYSHLIHFYPAKLLLNIPYFFLNCGVLTQNSRTVLDPFCGSGTVLLETILSGRSAYGADANPLARLISKVKTTYVPKEYLQQHLSEIIQNVNEQPSKLRHPQNLLDWKYWYSSRVFKDLCRLSYNISETKISELREFFQICLSQTARKVSMADPKVSVPVKLNPNKAQLPDRIKQQIQKLLATAQKANAVAIFKHIAENNMSRIERLNEINNLGHVSPLMDNAMNLCALQNESIDLIITSPPYAGAQKYIRSSGHSIGWLQLSPDETLRSLEKLNIGREHYSKSEYESIQLTSIREASDLLNYIREKNPLRAHIASNYLVEMQESLSECYRVLKKNGVFILVAGNNFVCSNIFKTQNYLQSICKQLGFKVELILRDDINSRGLMTKRNKTANIISCEWIIVLKK